MIFAKFLLLIIEGIDNHTNKQIENKQRSNNDEQDEEEHPNDSIISLRLLSNPN
jgi:hypothetical protein